MNDCIGGSFDPQRNNQVNYGNSVPILSSDVFDWNLIYQMDPKIIQETQDVQSMSKIVSSFILCQLSKSDFQIVRVPIVFKLLQLLQIVITYQLNVQHMLKSDLKKAKNNLKSINTQNTTIHAQNKKLKAALIKYRKMEKCPTCHSEFASIEDVHKHFKKSHPYLMRYYTAIRENQPEEVINMKNEEFREEIHTLKEIVLSQNQIQQKPIDAVPERPQSQILSPVSILDIQPYSLINLDNQSVSINPKKDLDELYEIPKKIQVKAKNFLNPATRHQYQPETIDDITKRISKMLESQTNTVLEKHSEKKKIYKKKIEEELPMPKNLKPLTISYNEDFVFESPLKPLDGESESDYYPGKYIAYRDQFTEAEYLSFSEQHAKLARAIKKHSTDSEEESSSDSDSDSESESESHESFAKLDNNVLVGILNPIIDNMSNPKVKRKHESDSSSSESSDDDKSKSKKKKKKKDKKKKDKTEPEDSTSESSEDDKSKSKKKKKKKDKKKDKKKKDKTEQEDSTSESSEDDKSKSKKKKKKDKKKDKKKKDKTEPEDSTTESSENDKSKSKKKKKDKKKDKKKKDKTEPEDSTTESSEDDKSKSKKKKKDKKKDKKKKDKTEPEDSTSESSDEDKSKSKKKKDKKKDKKKKEKHEFEVSSNDSSDETKSKEKKKKKDKHEFEVSSNGSLSEEESKKKKKKKSKTETDESSSETEEKSKVKSKSTFKEAFSKFIHKRKRKQQEKESTTNDEEESESTSDEITYDRQDDDDEETQSKDAGYCPIVALNNTSSSSPIEDEVRSLFSSKLDVLGSTYRDSNRPESKTSSSKSRPSSQATNPSSRPDSQNSKDKNSRSGSQNSKSTRSRSSKTEIEIDASKPKSDDSNIKEVDIPPGMTKERQEMKDMLNELDASDKKDKEPKVKPPHAKSKAQSEIRNNKNNDDDSMWAEETIGRDDLAKSDHIEWAESSTHIVQPPQGARRKKTQAAELMDADDD